MMFFHAWSLALTFHALCISAYPLRRATSVSSVAQPSVRLDNATVSGASLGPVVQFLGIPYAQPPVGNLRFQIPQPVKPYTGAINATAYGLSCPQLNFEVPTPDGITQASADYVHKALKPTVPDGEDCLTLNVITPAGVNEDSKLPVVVWFYSGGYEFGGTSGYNGFPVVNKSLALDDPVIFVSMNYRVNAFGFLPGQEVKDGKVGNLGLRDQREALRWIQKYIGVFGGDPSKVTIWGQSAGGMSVALQMLTNDGNSEGLFRAAFMQSGSPIPVGDITRGQKYYDALVEQTNCSGSNDTLQCLREAPYDLLKAAVDKSPSIFTYQSLDLAWLPRTDGDFIKETPQQLVFDGKVANVPFVTGDVEDEGTLFSLASTNVTTVDELKAYLKAMYLYDASDAQIEHLLKLYPADPAAGAPYGTGTDFQLTPVFKQLASIQGDIMFQATRRSFLNQRADKQKTWSFLSKYSKSIGTLGAVQTSDIGMIFGGQVMADYLIRFASSLDPNGKTGIEWPQYDLQSKQLLVFPDTNGTLSLTNDTYRAQQIDYCIALSATNLL